MRIKYKVIIIFCSLFLIYGIIIFLFQRIVVIPKFVQLEDVETKKNLVRTQEIILEEVYRLDDINRKYASSNETYKFIKNVSKDYIEENLKVDSFKFNRVNLIYFFDENRRLIWGNKYDFNTEQEISITGVPDKEIIEDDPLIQYDDLNNELSEVNVRGIINTKQGPLIISSRPILTGTGQGPLKGYLLMGTLIDKELLKFLMNRIRIKFKIVLPSQPQFNDLITQIQELDITVPFLQIKESIHKIHAFTTIYNIHNDPAFIIKITYPRGIILSGMASLNFALYFCLLAGVFILLIILYLLGNTIIRPITVLTQKVLSIESEDNLSEDTSAGHSDEIVFLSKSFDQMILKIQEKKKLLEKMAWTDALTQLLNRRTFDTRLDVEWRRMLREKKYLSAILLDIDYFKNFNDYYGHQEGDKCLKKVAKAISSEVKRAGDLCARYGGEEFIILLTNTSFNGSIIVAERIRKAIEDLKIEHCESKVDQYVTCSIGVSTLIPSNETSRIFLVKSADEALYMAKHAGRNRVARIYDF